MKDKAAGSGGAVIVSADGSRLEIAPSSRARTARPALLLIPKAGIAQRKALAQGPCWRATMSCSTSRLAPARV